MPWGGSSTARRTRTPQVAKEAVLRDGGDAMLFAQPAIEELRRRMVAIIQLFDLGAQWSRDHRAGRTAGGGCCSGTRCKVAERTWTMLWHCLTSLLTQWVASRNKIHRDGIDNHAGCGSKRVQCGIKHERSRLRRIFTDKIIPTIERDRCWHGRYSTGSCYSYR